MRGLLIILFLLSNVSFAQNLTIDTIVTSPAHCRTSNLQSGNGAIAIGISGGIPPYILNWINLQTGQPVYNVVIGGLNPGSYEVTVTDAVGDIIKDTISIDSINPIGNFIIEPNDLTFINGKYIAFEKADVSFYSTNEPPFTQPWPPNYIYKWSIDTNSQNWDSTASITIDQKIQHTYLPGIYNTCFINRNYNYCADTICYDIEVYNPSKIYNNTSFISLIPISDINGLKCYYDGFEEGVLVKVYNSIGQLIISDEVLEPYSIIDFNQSSGGYIYTIFNLKNGQEVGKGKFIF